MEKEEKEAKSKEKILKVGEKNKKAKRCKYFNVGYCKYKDECKFIHPKDICKGYLQGNCSGSESDCQGRHPKVCKWFERETGCKRKDDCEFFHDTRACSDRKNLSENQNKRFKCVSLNGKTVDNLQELALQGQLF